MSDNNINNFLHDFSPTFTCLSEDNPVLNVGSLNVNGLLSSSSHKHSSLSSLLYNFNLHVLGVCDTHFTKAQGRHFNTNYLSPNFCSWWASPTSFPVHTGGVGLILHSSIAKYVC